VDIDQHPDSHGLMYISSRVTPYQMM
jgi:hypothetical protein